MSADYRIKFLGHVDGQGILKRMQPLSLRTFVHKERDSMIELLAFDGRTLEHEGLGTNITVDVDKQHHYTEQRRQVLEAIQRVMDTGSEDFMVGYYDRLVIVRLNGAVERFHEPELTPSSIA